jgi:two-component system response regulator GlrR
MLRLLSMRLRRPATASPPCLGRSGAGPAGMERPQLVLSDVRLPGRDGLALFDEIRQRTRRCR